MEREGQKSGYVVHGWPPGVKRLKILEFGIFIEARFSQHPIDKYIKNQNHVSKNHLCLYDNSTFKVSLKDQQLIIAIFELFLSLFPKWPK